MCSTWTLRKGGQRITPLITLLYSIRSWKCMEMFVEIKERINRVENKHNISSVNKRKFTRTYMYRLASTIDRFTSLQRCICWFSYFNCDTQAKPRSRSSLVVVVVFSISKRKHRMLLFLPRPERRQKTSWCELND